MNSRAQALLSLSVLFLVLCGNVPNSPYDENSPDFVKPVIRIDAQESSLKPNDTIRFDTASLLLVGNMIQSRFQVKLDNASWSSWKPSGIFPFSSLSDGRHVVYINTMYEGGTKIVSDSIIFFVSIFNEPMGGIKGILVSNKNVAKVSGAVVTLSPGSVTTTSDIDGIFQFTNLGQGAYSITVTMDGYQDYTQTSIEVDGSTTKDLSVIVLTVSDSGTGNLKVVYDGNGSTGGSVPVDQKTYKSGMTVAVLGNTGNLVKTGSVFSGWNTKVDGSGTGYLPGETFAITSTIILYAKWNMQSTLTMTYDGNGKTGGTVPVDANKYAAGDSVIVLGNSGDLVKTGASFVGWNTKPDGSGTDYNAGSKFPISSSITTLYAKWTTNPTYAVVYHKNGADSGSAPEEAKYEAGATVTISDNTGKLKKNGYIFGGWNTKADGTGTSYTAGATFTKTAVNDTLYAKWTIATYTVKFNSRDGSAVDSQKVNYGSKVNKPADPTRTGYAFGGWYKESGCTNAWDFSNTTVTADMTLYAKWTIVAYTIDFNSQGGSEVTPQTINYGSKVNKPADPTRTGYTFGGWYKESGCTNAWDFENATVTANITLYAKWTIMTYTVDFNSQGGSEVNPQTINYGSKVNKPADPTRIGYDFGGWYKESGCVNAWNFTSMTVSADMTLYAKWTIKKCTVKFNSQGGSSVDLIEVNYGSKVSKPTDPTRTGYTFSGWYKEAACTNQWLFAVDEVTDPVTLFAKWTINQYTVTFNSQGGSGVASQTVNYDGHATPPTNPTRGCYTFGGWYKQAACTNQWSFANDVVTGPVTLYAKWTITPLTIIPAEGTLTNVCGIGGSSDFSLTVQTAPSSCATGYEWHSYMPDSYDNVMTDDQYAFNGTKTATLHFINIHGGGYFYCIVTDAAGNTFKSGSWAVTICQ